MTTESLAKLPVNNYGQVDVRNGVPAGFVHINAKRLTVTCSAAGVECAPALTGWKSGRWGGPEISGVVVRASDEAKVREAMQRRASKRLTPAQKEARRAAQHDQDAADFAEATAPISGGELKVFPKTSVKTELYTVLPTVTEETPAPMAGLPVFKS